MVKFNNFPFSIFNRICVKRNCRFGRPDWRKTHRFVRCISNDIRNIGIMAHIDAGKTTTTERMLYYAGHILKMGDIDAGDTVMDYLPTERERGITVQSAAITFKWNGAEINLIDTPGHVDFTIEVERSLRVLDGAIAIFDAAKGVEAQSRTVWRQADHYNVPRIAYINKMDKSRANLAASIDSIKSQLKANTIILQLPLMDQDIFCGVVDIVSLDRLEWNMSEMHSNRSGRPFKVTKLTPSDQLWSLCMDARASAIEKLCEVYDDVAVTWLEGKAAGDAAAISSDQLQRWIRRGTIERAVVPVLFGSSFRNVAVQPLLDAVIRYLPKPSDIQHKFT